MQPSYNNDVIRSFFPIRPYTHIICTGRRSPFLIDFAVRKHETTLGGESFARHRVSCEQLYFAIRAGGEIPTNNIVIIAPRPFYLWRWRVDRLLTKKPKCETISQNDRNRAVYSKSQAPAASRIILFIRTRRKFCGHGRKRANLRTAMGNDYENRWRGRRRSGYGPRTIGASWPALDFCVCTSSCLHGFRPKSGVNIFAGGGRVRV